MNARTLPPRKGWENQQAYHGRREERDMLKAIKRIWRWLDYRPTFLRLWQR